MLTTYYSAWLWCGLWRGCVEEEEEGSRAHVRPGP
ncbi:hypothetical protein CABS01_13705 [Colletotrichum abscissum]|nr:uncharacterized protein CABS01_13705 [Colletotrichum abscissum]KAK1484948.1 hypothetical protein CABS01_13705 [Colletotrichum abscissum]